MNISSTKRTLVRNTSNLSDRNSHFLGLLVYHYDQEKDIFTPIRNRIIVPQEVEIPIAVTVEVYANKNIFKDVVMLKFGITQSSVSEEDPDFVSIIASGLLYLDCRYPIDLPLKIICSVTENGNVRGRIINSLNDETIWEM
jgi:hypothetical protein